MTTKRVNHFSVLLKFPDKNVSKVSRSNEVLELIRYYQVCYVVFIRGQALVFEIQLSRLDIVKACFHLRPCEYDPLLFIDFKSFYPQRHAFEFDFRTELKVHCVTFRVEHQSLLRVIFAEDFEVEHITAINSSCYQTRLGFIEVSVVDQPNLQRERFDMVQVFIEDMKFEISRNSQIELILLTYEFILHGKLMNKQCMIFSEI
jgi:hypothetical protein